MKILYLFPDTNLFIQCRALHELDWSSLRESDEIDEIHLIVCRAVQREIDGQKQRGNDRVGKRARHVHSIFREIISGSNGYELIKDSAPKVKLFVDPSILPSPEIGNRLDYQETDDRIVGSVHAYKKSHPDSDARLLTHDSGPMASARMLCLPFIGIPDSWIRPPETTKAERENERLRLELERIKNDGPRFAITFLGDDENEIDSWEFNWDIYEKLPDVIVSDVIDRLEREFPISSDFGPQGSMARRSGLLGTLGDERRFRPASSHEVYEYNRKYTMWIELCKDILRRIHISLNEQSHVKSFCFSLKNEGTRPGQDTLVTITASGNFSIMPPPTEESEGSDRALSFPPPPESPKGKWVAVPSTYERLMSAQNPQIRAYPFANMPLDPVNPVPVNQERDPNEFYYTPDQPTEPSESLSFKCKQWRHGMNAEDFKGDLYIDQIAEEIRGSLKCIIHAGNLSNPEYKIIPVKGKPNRSDTAAVARKMVDDLVNARKQHK